MLSQLVTSNGLLPYLKSMNTSRRLLMLNGSYDIVRHVWLRPRSAMAEVL